MEERPKHFLMPIQGGMLEALGINMYTSIGKCLVEFVANSYDSDASRVSVSVPTEEIQKALSEIRDAAKVDATSSDRGKSLPMAATLPKEIQIIIEDDGHGMSIKDVGNKFLPINRNRRKDDSTGEASAASESGRRQVMGRKGLGKLAGFGAAEFVKLWTKRQGESFATICEMDYQILKEVSNLQGEKLPASYEDGLPEDLQGTKIILSRLKCDSFKKYGDGPVINTLRENFFGIESADFQILVNGNMVEQENAAYEFVYPEDRSGEFAHQVIKIEDVGGITFDYIVKFRARQEDPIDISGDQDSSAPLKRGSLAASKRGARIYCKGRLAAGPTLLDLRTGMHNFHSQSYMECIVRADDLDNRAIDLINTNRTQLREDNEVVKEFVGAITQVMKDAIQAHSRYRDKRADDDIKKSKEGALSASIIKRLPAKQRSAARRLLRMLVARYGVGSEQFKSSAPLVLDSLNASDVLVRLAELGSDPESISKIAGQLLELGHIERRDALKLYRGRRSGINALRRLIDKGDATKRSGPHFEDDLHQLLKSNPWLIKPEYSGYLTSNKNVSTVASRMAKRLNVDDFAASKKAVAERPDLVFLMAESDTPHRVVVVELKSPSIPLDTDHLNQLESYMRQVEEFANQLPQKIQVHGYLIGRKPDDSIKAEKSKGLIWKLERRGVGESWEVLGLEQMLQDTHQVHLEAIKAFEKNEEEDADNES